MLMSYVVKRQRKGRKSEPSSLKNLAVVTLNWTHSIISISLVLVSPWNTIIHKLKLVMESNLVLIK